MAIAMAMAMAMAIHGTGIKDWHYCIGLHRGSRVYIYSRKEKINK